MPDPTPSERDDTPAQAFHVGEYIDDELKARGWTPADLAARMEGDPNVNECMIELYIHCGDMKGLLPMSRETAENFGRAFGTGPEIWQGLERLWVKWREHNDRARAANGG